MTAAGTPTIALTDWAWLKERVRPFYETGDPGHDVAHIDRVTSACFAIGRELGADLDVLMPAAFLHDVVNIPKNSPDRAQASRLAAARARELLAGDVPEARLARIVRAIEEHSYSRGLAPSSLEAAILQDADRLDAIGAIGVMRTVSCGAGMGASYYDSGDPFPGAHAPEHQRRALDGKRFTIDHFYEKLLRLEAGMNTEPARREARRRTEFMLRFLEELRAELAFAQD